MLEDQPTGDGEVDPAAAAEWSRTFAARATGTSVPAIQEHRIEQLAGTAGVSAFPSTHAGASYAAVHTLAAISPRNELEAMLSSQMVATHNAAMGCLAYAAESLETREVRSSEMRNATRLLQIYTRQIDAMTRLRSLDVFGDYQGLEGHKNPYVKRDAKSASSHQRK